jgi:hypothetical protein
MAMKMDSIVYLETLLYRDDSWEEQGGWSLEFGFVLKAVMR